jgi:hypothetical protein
MVGQESRRKGLNGFGSEDKNLLSSLLFSYRERVFHDNENALFSWKNVQNGKGLSVLPRRPVGFGFLPSGEIPKGLHAEEAITR